MTHISRINSDVESLNRDSKQNNNKEWYASIKLKDKHYKKIIDK